MKDAMQRRGARRGFTILELLVVISIMAIIATLATGAALKAVKQSRNKKIDATCRALEVALGNYRAEENKWPVKLNPQNNAITVWYHGVDNKQVFGPLYQGSSGNRSEYLDVSGLLGDYNGRRGSLRALLSDGSTDVALIYPDPDEASRKRYFCVEFNLPTDSVKVHRQSGHNCPKFVQY